MDEKLKQDYIWNFKFSIVVYLLLMALWVFFDVNVIGFCVGWFLGTLFWPWFWWKVYNA